MYANHVSFNAPFIWEHTPNSPAGRCYVWGMYVLESFQSNGVGGSLLQSCFEKARTNQCSALEVMVIQSSTKAVMFYLSSGFAKLDQTTYEIVAGIELASWRMERSI